MVINVNLFIQLNVARKKSNHPQTASSSISYFRHFPNCAYGAECLYIHPTCRFAGACTRSDCPYLHSTVTPASSPNDNATAPGRSSANNRSEICKFGVQCMRPNCIYSHPRMPFPPNRNYKWVNSKW